MSVIEGTSGSGKSTFLNYIGGLDILDSGSIMVDGMEIVGMKSDKLSDCRIEYNCLTVSDFPLYIMRRNKFRNRRRLTSDVAHELRTQIDNVSSHLEAIMRAYENRQQSGCKAVIMNLAEFPILSEIWLRH